MIIEYNIDQKIAMKQPFQLYHTSFNRITFILIVFDKNYEPVALLIKFAVIDIVIKALLIQITTSKYDDKLNQMKYLSEISNKNCYMFVKCGC